MLTIFLDIDGTLIRTRGAGLDAIKQIMSIKYGVTKLPAVEVHGRTDFAIWQDIFRNSNLQPPTDLSPLIEEYCILLETNLQQDCGIELPGAVDLLQTIWDAPEICAGLLTGNAKQAAAVKLKQFGLNDYVQDFGGFGDSESNRNEVAKIAFDSARCHLREQFRSDRMWVIGDTVHDINCARSIGARVAAVATGGQSFEELRAAKPDVLLHDLSETQKILAVLCKS